MQRKTTLWTFLTTNKRHLTGENVDGAMKEILMRETESLLIAAQNIKAITDKPQQPANLGFVGIGDETINKIISERSKLA